MPELSVPSLSESQVGILRGAPSYRVRSRALVLVLCEMRMKFSLIWTIPGNRCIAVGPFPVPI
jgi:hypothetical protein